MKKIGLIGKKLGHSYSPEIHKRLGMDYTYTLQEVAPDAIAAFLSETDYEGFNVTIPYKKDIIPYLADMSPTAKRLGSVNTVVRTGDGFVGYNTDYDGFRYELSRSGFDVKGKKALVLGNGGVAPTVCAVLRDVGAAEVVVVAHKDNTPAFLAHHRDAALLVNTTPVGMYPGNLAAPLSLDLLPRLACVLDLIYNPFETALLADARERGLITSSGISMLVAQAKRAAELFSGKPLPTELTDCVIKEMIHARRNIVLIGMPGCGKSTLGQALASKLGKTFVDVDALIVSLAGKSIPDIFAEDGEEVFRRWEHKAICTCAAESAQVIATGGGCVTRRENYRPLAQNGVIVYIDRPVEALPTAGRPLSVGRTPAVLYKERAPLYRAFADCSVQNDGPVSLVAEKILAAVEALPPALRT